MTLGPHTAIVRDEIVRLLDATTAPATRAVLGELADELDRPLRLAVTGRVNAGKSTLVNALLRQRIAPTDVSESTQYAAWFRFVTPERVEVVGPDGTRRQVALRPDGRLPAALGDLNDHDVARIDVFLSNETLRTMTLIDTPGLASSRDDVQVTDAVLALDRRTRVALAEAEAMLFVVAGDLRSNEAVLLDEFHRITGGLAPTSVNTLAVVSRVDQVVDVGVDPIGAASATCAALGRQLRSTASHVLPIVGLLAETAESGALTDADLALLSTMAEDRQRFQRALLSVDRFARAEQIGGTPSQRERLLDLLDLHGLWLLAERIGAGSATPRQLVDELRARSGIDGVRAAIHHDLTNHADVLKASWALGGLQDLAFKVDLDDRDRLIDLAERLELSPAMHRVAEISALREVAGEHADLASVDADEVRRLVHGRDAFERLGAPSDTDSDEARAIAVGAAGRWRAAGNDGSASPSLRSIAAVFARSYELLAAELQVQR